MSNLNGNGETIKVGSGSSTNVSGNNDTIDVASGATGVNLSVSGSGDVVNLAGGSGDTLDPVSGVTLVLEGVNTGDAIGGSGDTIDVDASGDSFSAQDDTLVLAANTQTTVSGTGDSFKAAGSASSVVLTASGEGATVTLNADSNSSLTLNGSSGDTVNAAGDRITLAAGNTGVVVNGGGDTVAVAGTGDSFSASSASITLAAATSTSVSGNGDAIVAASGASGVSVSVSGASDTVTLEGGSGDSVTANGEAVDLGAGTVRLNISGSGDAVSVEGSGDSFSAENAVVTLSSGTQSGDLSGIGNAIQSASGARGVSFGMSGTSDSATLNNASGSSVTLEGGNVDTVNANGDTVVFGAGNTNTAIKGSEDTIDVTGTGNTFTANGDAVVFSGGSGAVLSGDGDTVTTAAGASDVSVSVNGSGDSLTLGAGVTGVTVNGAGNTLDVTGSGDSLTASGDTIVVSAGVQGTGLSGNGDSVELQSGSQATVAGNGDAVAVAAGADGVAVGVSGTGDSVALQGGSGDTVTASGETLTLTGTNTGVGVAGTGDTLFVEGSGDVLDVDSDTLFLAADTRTVLDSTGNTTNASDDDQVTDDGGSDNVFNLQAFSSADNTTSSVTLIDTTGDTVSSVGNTLVLEGTNGGATLTGAGNTVDVTGTATLAAGGDTLDLSGTGTALTLSGGNDTVIAAAGTSLVSFSDDVSYVIQANDATVEIVGNDTAVDVQGQGDTVFLQGGSDVLVCSGSGETISAAGNGDSVTASDSSVTFHEDGDGSLEGSGDSVTLQAQNMDSVGGALTSGANTITAQGDTDSSVALMDPLDASDPVSGIVQKTVDLSQPTVAIQGEGEPPTGGEATVLDLANASQVAYGKTGAMGSDWDQVTSAAMTAADTNAQGYFGEAWVDPATGELIIADRGTDLGDGVAIAAENLAEDASLGVGIPPTALLTDAENFADDAINAAQSELTQDGDSVSQILTTGHSLGGYEAQYQAVLLSNTPSLTDVPIINLDFDAPGLGADFAQVADSSVLTSYNFSAQGDLVNLAGGDQLGGSAGNVSLPFGPSLVETAGLLTAGAVAGPLLPASLSLLIAGANETLAAHNIGAMVAYLQGSALGSTTVDDLQGLTAAQIEALAGQGTGTLAPPEFGANGFDPDGYDAGGYDAEGFDVFGYNSGGELDPDIPASGETNVDAVDGVTESVAVQQDGAAVATWSGGGEDITATFNTSRDLTSLDATNADGSTSDATLTPSTGAVTVSDSSAASTLEDTAALQMNADGSTTSTLTDYAADGATVTETQTLQVFSNGSSIEEDSGYTAGQVSSQVTYVRDDDGTSLGVDVGAFSQGVVVDANGATVSVGTLAQADVVGDQDTVALVSEDGVTVTGNGDAVSSGTLNQENTVAVSGDDDSVALSDFDNTVDLASANACTVSGFAESVDLGSGVTGAVLTGADDTVEVGQAGGATSDDSLSVSGSTVDLTDSTGVELTGGDDGVNLYASSSLDLSDSAGDTIAAPSSDPVTLGASVTKADFTDSGDRIAVDGTDDSLTAGGADITATGASGSVLSGNGDTVDVADKDDSISLSDSSSDTVTEAAGDTVTLQAGVTGADFTGSGDRIAVDGHGDSLTAVGADITASGAGGSTLSGNNDTVDVSDKSDGIALENTVGDTVTEGSTDTVTLESGVGATFTGTGNNIVVAASDAVAASGSTITVDRDATATLASGSDDTVHITAQGVVLNVDGGSGDKIDSGPVTEGVDGDIEVNVSNADITVFGSGDVITVNGTGDTIGATDSTIGFQDGGDGTVHGNGDTIHLDAGGVDATILGNSDDVEDLGSNESTTLDGNSDDISAGSSSGGDTLVANGEDDTDSSGSDIADNGSDDGNSFDGDGFGNYGYVGYGFVGGSAAPKAGSISLIAQYDLAHGDKAAAAAVEAAEGQAAASADAAATAGTGSAVLEGARWDQQVLTWNMAGSANGEGGLPSVAMGAAYQPLVEEAFAQWAAATGLTFVETPDGSAADISVGFSDFGTSATGIAGFTGTTLGPDQALASAAIAVEDPNQTALVQGSGGALTYVGTDTTLLQLLEHEIGHALGFADNSDQDSVLYWQLNSQNRGLDATDLAGAQELYGPGAAGPAGPAGPGGGAGADQLIQALAGADSGAPLTGSLSPNPYAAGGSPLLALA